MTEATVTSYEPEAEKSDLSDWVGVIFTLIPIVRRYWWIVALVAVCLTSLGGLYLFTRQNLYRAEATIVLTPGLGQKSDSDLNDMASKDLNVFINTQLQLLRSSEVISKALKDINADKWPEYVGNDLATIERKVSDSLDITMPNQTAILSVSILAPDKDHACLMVNAVCDSYLRKCKDMMRGIRGERFTQEETAGETSQARYLDLCQRVDTYMREHQITPDQSTYPNDAMLRQLSVDKDAADRQVKNLQNQVDQADAARKQFEARTAGMAAADLERPENDIVELLQLPRVQTDDMVERISTQVFNQEAVVSTARATLGPDNQNLHTQLDLLWALKQLRQDQVDKTIQSLRLELELAKAKAATVDNAYDQCNQDYNVWRNSLIELNSLLRQKREAETTYEDVRSNRDRSQILSRMDLLPASTWNAATVPEKPYDQKVPLKLVMIFLASLVAGVLAAVGYDRTDSSIRTREDLARYIHPTLLGSIPFAEPNEYGKEVAKISVHYPGSPVAEAFRTIRTSLTISLPKTPGRGRLLMMTSSIPSEGKSSCCCNLAAIFAQNNLRVLLIDADLRRPTLRANLGLTKEVGLAEFLQGSKSVEEVVQRSTVLEIDVISSGHPPANPAELLSGSRYKEVLEWARSRYDWVILDTPPVVPVTDARIMAEHVDGIISVVRSFYTPRGIVQRGMELLRETHIPILGLICNNAEGYELGHYVKGFGYSSYASYGSYKYTKYTNKYTTMASKRATTASTSSTTAAAVSNSDASKD